MYSTLSLVKNELKGTLTVTTYDGYLLRTIRTITNRIRNLAGIPFDFEPVYEARKFTVNALNTNTTYRLLTLTNPQQNYLLEVDSIVSDGVTLTWNTDVEQYPQNGYAPVTALRLPYNSQAAAWWPCNSNDTFNTVVITGWWGYKERYAADGWLSVDAITNVGGINASVTSLTVADADGADYFGQTPRFSPGNLIRIEDEMLEVTATDTTTNTLTVLRGQRGTTAAAHAQTTAVKVWNIEFNVQYACTRAACYNYARKGAFETTQIQDLTTINYPPDFPAQVKAILQEFQYA